MVCRTKLSQLAVIFPMLLAATGCGYTQQSRFQTAFLPAAPLASAAADFGQPPVIEPNPYVRDVPPLIRTSLTPPPSSFRSDELIGRAERHMQTGRRLYQEQDTERARAEFDSAVDLMLQAGEMSLADRRVWERKLESMVDTVHRYDLAGLGASVNLDEQRFDKVPLEDILQMTFPVDPNLKNKVREQALATASQLPLSMNDSVTGYIHYFMGRGHRTLVAGLERAGRYRPMIQRIFSEEGVPQELIHLAQAESGFYPRAVSRAAATGMWQFMAFRGQQYGLKQTRYSDERLDPEKATRAAARHLRDLYNQFGDWYLAIAAYNCGPGAVEKAVERTGFADFWQLRERRVLPAETTNYVPIILAMTIMAKNADEYGLVGLSPEAPLEYEDVEMTAPTHLALVSDLIEVPLSELVQMNPALLKSVAPEGYSLHVPKGLGQTLRASLERIPLLRRASWRIHKVTEGETLSSIGKRYKTTADSIAAANGAAAAQLAEGERLLIPAAVAAEKPVVKKAVRRGTRHSASKRTGHSTRAAARPRARSKSASAAPSGKPARRNSSVLARNGSGRQTSAAASN
jgi:membrane-bound lytic murein transglycosylase D